MKKVLITIIVLLLIAVLGIGGYFVWRLNEKIDEQSNAISTLVNEVKGNKEENNTVENNTTNTTTNTTNTTTNTTSNTVTNSTATNNVAGTTTTTPTENTDEAKVKQAYLDLLKQSYPNYKDYRIDSVKVLTGAEKQELIATLGGDYYKDTDILAVVTYSLKPESMQNYTIAGNGEIQGEWVVNKSACVAYRDGKIVSNGTGW